MSFEQLLVLTPECNDFRRLGDGTWMAYSTVLDEEGVAKRANGQTIGMALENLRKDLGYLMGDTGL